MKRIPRDIDLVSLIDHQLVDQYETDLERFTKEASKETYGIDGYVVRIYPQGHPYYVRTQSDLIYWEHWFSHSKKNSRKKRFAKGFIEIEF